MTHPVWNRLPDTVFKPALTMCAYVWVWLNANLNTLSKACWTTLYRHVWMCTCVLILQTLPRMSRCPWLAARWSGVSSPRFITLMRAPLIMSMSTTLERPSRHAQCSGLNPWSSLRHTNTQKPDGQIKSGTERLVLEVTSCPDRNERKWKTSCARFVGFIVAIFIYFDIAANMQLFMPSTWSLMADWLLWWAHVFKLQHITTRTAERATQYRKVDQVR